MAADGSDITCLSFHETNEWHPSVTHDGRIIYTRWDYVDRHGCTAHLPWITTLDGRDSRAVHGNFAPRGSRPDMELDCRAIPGSHKFVATAAPHHGQAYGSLVLIDPHVPTTTRMGPVRRITPEVGFPESQGGAQVYGTAWPLSEDYYLCVYDATMQPGAGFQGGAVPAGQLRHLPGRQLRQQGADLPRSGDRLPEPDPAAADGPCRTGRPSWPNAGRTPNPADAADAAAGQGAGGDRSP